MDFLAKNNTFVSYETENLLFIGTKKFLLSHSIHNVTMKKLVLFCLCAVSFAQLSAQIEIKISPVGLLFETFAASVETAVSENVGLDIDAVYNAEFSGFNVSGKYYFNPKYRIDGFHIGAFTGNLGDDFGFGFLAGTKLVSKKNITFEAALGIGRSVGGGVVAYGKLHLGYRFSGKRDAKTKAR